MQGSKSKHGMDEAQEEGRKSSDTNKTLFKSAVFVSMLYGVKKGEISKMQKVVNGWERVLMLGSSEGTKDMVGKMTRQDVRARLDTRSIHLEIDIRIGEATIGGKGMLTGRLALHNEQKDV